VEDLNEIIKREHIDEYIKKEHITDASFQSPSDFSVSSDLKKIQIDYMIFNFTNFFTGIPR